VRRLLGSFLVVGVAGAAATSTGAVPRAAPVYGYAVVTTRPHDKGSFTEGLAYQPGYLIESSGLHSSLRRVALRTGRVVRRVDLASRYFGEGATVLGGRVYQLTWREHTAFVYDLKTFKRIRTFRYAGEGWGLADDGSSLIMSDGSATITFRDPKTFAVRRRVVVTDAGQSIEVVRGRVCANVFGADRIACFDPRTGEVRYWIDLTNLYPRELRSDEEAVLNGIAYDAKHKRLFVTGKLWPRLYQIRLVT
jgi:glutaminyl-peptide cyclotransferase